MSSTEYLIGALAGDLRPVRPVRAPLLKAAAWLAAIAGVTTGAAWLTGAWPLMLTRLADSRFAIEFAATLATGVSAVAAAFMLAIPDRRREWAFLPLPFLAVWLLSSSYGCYDSWLVLGPGGSLRLGRSSDCFIFIIGLSIPLAAALWLALRRSAAALDPLRVTAVGGLGIAALAAAALQFWHPFDVTVADLAAHAAAVALVCGAAVTAGPRSFRLN